MDYNHPTLTICYALFGIQYRTLLCPILESSRTSDPRYRPFITPKLRHCHTVDLPRPAPEQSPSSKKAVCVLNSVNCQDTCGF